MELEGEGTETETICPEDQVATVIQANVGEKDVQLGPTSTTIEGKRRSWVWEEYIKIDGSVFPDGKRRATCKHCNKHTFIAESHYGTSSLAKHLRKCALFQATKTCKGKEVRFDQNVYRELVAKAIIKHGCGFSWVEHEGNREIHTYLNNQVTTISRNTIKSDCLKLHAKLKKKLKETLLSLPGRICLTSDLWTSCQTEGYLCLTAHYVDSDWKLNSRVLNFCHLEPPHSGSVLCDIVFELLQEWGIHHKLFSITLDNASSNDRMQDLLKLKLVDKRALLGCGQYFHIRCAAHTLNLVVKDGLKAIDDCVSKVRESVKYIKASEARKMLFQQCVKRAMIRETKALWLDVPTRWNSTYFMLDRALLCRRAFKELSKTDLFYKSFPTDDEWERIDKINELLAPFSEISDMFSGSQYPTANLYFENVWKIDMFIKEQMESNDPIIRDMVVLMREKFDKYWSDYTLLFAFAVVLDPRCKLAFLTFCYEKLYGDKQMAISKAHEVRQQLEMLLMEYSKSNCTNSLCNVSSTPSLSIIQGSLRSPPRKRKRSYSAEFDENNGTPGSSSMLDAYLEDSRLDRKKELDILTFWKQNEQKYGELAHLARDILSVPLTTVASESTFSIGGRILSKWKSSYIPENVEALITTRSWLYDFESDGDEEFNGSSVEWMSGKSTKSPRH